MRRIDIQKMMKTGKIAKLDKQNEYMLHLFNNNYSGETVYNYNRDLSFFAEYLRDSQIPFEKINKLTVTYYKGWLKQRSHIIKKVKSLDNMVLLRKNASKTDDALQNESKDMVQAVNSGYVKNNNPDVLDAQTINRLLISLRTYLRFLVEYDYPSPIPPDAVQLVRSPKKKPQVATLEEIVALIEAPTTYEPVEILGLRNRAILELLLATGMRISEVVSINREGKYKEKPKKESIYRCIKNGHDIKRVCHHKPRSNGQYRCE